MFKAMKLLGLQPLHDTLTVIAEKVEQNKVVAIKAVESIKKSNGQIPAAVRNQPYKIH